MDYPRLVLDVQVAKNVVLGLSVCAAPSGARAVNLYSAIWCLRPETACFRRRRSATRMQRKQDTPTYPSGRLRVVRPRVRNHKLTAAAERETSGEITPSCELRPGSLLRKSANAYINRNTKEQKWCQQARYINEVHPAETDNLGGLIHQFQDLTPRHALYDENGPQQAFKRTSSQSMVKWMQPKPKHRRRATTQAVWAIVPTATPKNKSGARNPKEQSGSSGPGGMGSCINRNSKGEIVVEEEAPGQPWATLECCIAAIHQECQTEWELSKWPPPPCANCRRHKNHRHGDWPMVHRRPRRYGHASWRN